MPKPKSKKTEVVASPDNDRRQRRRFSAEEKARILKEADACTERGELGELLRREGIYSSHLANWRAQRDQQGQAGLEPKRPGPKPTKDAKDRRIEQLEKRIAKQGVLSAGVRDRRTAAARAGIGERKRGIKMATSWRKRGIKMATS